ncbi:DNRLRE domain-containing protein [Streptomyces sp. NPDC092359]|uniref:DNRLRE domain-containing protein n=1 Tax=Streptomyces sp. NPDC092359 TaxID=3366014 RepID=UPI003823A985
MARGPGGLRATATGLALLTAASSLYGAEAATAVPTAYQASPAQPDQQRKAPATAADIPSARVAALLSGTRVEALSERTESSTTWVGKDGSLTSELSAGPIRFRDPASGEWRNVDVALTESADGSVTSKAHPRGLRLAGKAGPKAASLKAAQAAPATDLVTLGEGDQAITLQWRGGLPKPVLDGTRATYENAVPGADVVVEATRTGFEQFVEVKARPAAGFSYTLPLRTKGLKVTQQADGSVLFTDRKSRKTAVMPAPVMWDAGVDEVSGEHTRRARVGMKVVKVRGGVDLVMTPDAGFLADPATKYPVTVDPSTSALGNLFDTYVQQGETVDWSNDTELDFGNPGTKNADGTWRTARSFITWNTAPVADALISSATLSLWNFHSGNTDCTAQPWELWTANTASTASRWTNQPSMVTKTATSTETKGNPGCASQPDGWVNADATSLVQHWANNKWTSSGMGLRATDENNTKQWKRVNSANAATNPPKLTVTYNYRPRTGTKQEAGAPFFSYNGAYTVNSTTPTLRDTFVDANGDKVNGTFQIFDAATDTQVGNVLVSPYVPSGQVASVTVPAGVLTNGRTYRFRTNPYDGAHYNLGWSAWKTFTVDSTAPSAPTAVTSTDYPSNAWVKGAGQAGVFHVTPPAADHNWIEWSLDGTTWTKVATNGAAGAKALTVTPPQDGTHTLQVRTVDKADNKSEQVDYVFHAGPGGFAAPADGERTARRLPLVAEAESGKYDKVSFFWRRSEADAWTQIPAGHVTSAGTALTAWPVPLVGGRNAPLVWNATDTVDPDGSIQIKASFTGPNSAAGGTDPLPVVVDRDASGAAEEQIGPGSVNLLTGDYGLSATDTSVFDLTVKRSASSRRPGQGAEQEGQAAIFGKEWAAGAVAETASVYAYLRKASDTAVAVVNNDGSETHFTANAAKTAWVPEPGAESLTLTGAVTGSFTLTETDGTVTTFTKPDPALTTWQVSTTLQDGLANSTNTVVTETVTVNGKKLVRPVRVNGATPAANGATCTATPSTKGCRSLEYVYATSTTATALAFGDYTGQVKEIRVWATEPGAATATARTVHTYAYDAEGRLRQAWNPLIAPALKTEYAYDAAGRVTTLTPPGELPWSFTYGRAGNAATAGDGMLLKVSRAALKQGTADTVEGTAAIGVVYDVPVTGAKAPYQMGAAQTRTWGQAQAPTDAAAVFPADAVPASHDGSALTAGSYGRADIRYLGVSGQESNAAAPGGHLTTTEYDRVGNIVRELSAANRAVALGLTAADRAVQADLGIGALDSAERAELLSSSTLYSENGVRELETLGPIHRIDLTQDLKQGATTLVAAGTSVPARDWVVKEYDEGRPTDGSASIRDRVTVEVRGAQVRDHYSVMGDKRVKESQYDWVKGQPTLSIKDSGGLNLTSSWGYDAQGRVVSSVLPGGTGDDAASKVTAYWTADGTGWCKGRPEWAGLVCWSGPAGAVTGGGSQPADLIDTSSEYDWWGNPAKAVETANGTARTTTVTYDGAGRRIKDTVTGGLGQAVPDSITEYDPATGKVARTTSATAGTVARSYDRLGRLISYTDADAGTTTTQYDLLGRPVRVSDSAPSTVTYAYDPAVEPRGMATSMTDSVAGTFGATYGVDGSVTAEKLPGGYTMRQTMDTAGNVTGRSYTRDSDGTAVYTDAVGKSVHGQTTTHSGWSDQAYRYDAAGRLTSVEDTSETVCTARAYTFDKRSNRTSLTTAAGTPGAACPTTGGTTTTHTYDSGDRLVDAGYAYDALGRTTSVPGGGTFGYYANDLVHQQTVGGQRQTFKLDASRRLRSWTVEKDNAGTWSTTQSKVNHYGADGDSPRWITEDTASGKLTRNVGSASAGLAATTSATGEVVLQLSNIHGDVALRLPLDSAVAPLAVDADEYGNARPGSSTGRYNWLGASLRSAETLTGITLMGVRLYDPRIGRFLSVDPMNGGSCNAYDYACADPQNKYDTDGTYLRERVQSNCRQDVCVRIRRICESNTGRCSLNWDFHFRKSWANSWINAGFKWYIHVSNTYVKSGTYSHGEFGSYNFHGGWYSNNNSKGRGWFKCGWWQCRLDAGDTVMFSAYGTAWRYGRGYAWSVGQSFGGGGRYS